MNQLPLLLKFIYNYDIHIQAVGHRIGRLDDQALKTHRFPSILVINYGEPGLDLILLFYRINRYQGIYGNETDMVAENDNFTAAINFCRRLVNSYGSPQY
jgi:hypothetical protein